MLAMTQMLNVKCDQCTLTKRELHTLESGKEDSVMVKGSKFGWMEHATMASGRIIELMDRVNSLISMEMFTRGTG